MRHREEGTDRSKKIVHGIYAAALTAAYAAADPSCFGKSSSRTENCHDRAVEKLLTVSC
jgi:hypothetical protein